MNKDKWTIPYHGVTHMNGILKRYQVTINSFHSLHVIKFIDKHAVKCFTPFHEIVLNCEIEEAKTIAEDYAERHRVLA